MDWRFISAVTLAGASFSMVAFGAYTLRAADAVPLDAGRAALPLVAPTLMPIDVGAAGTVRLEPGVSFVPVALRGDAPAEGLVSPGAQVAAIDGASPVLVADLPVQDKFARPSWRWRHGHHVAWKVDHRANVVTVLRPYEMDRKHQVATRHSEEQHGAPRMALVLGVGF